MVQSLEKTVFPYLVYNGQGEIVGQFQLQIHQQLFAAALRPTSVRERVQAMLANAQQLVNDSELSGVGFAEIGVGHPYEEIEAALTEGLADLKQMQQHVHAFGDDGFCACGFDGNT